MSSPFDWQVSFGHGVASGDPWPDGVLLWTRVTTGLPVVSVTWEVSRTLTFERPVTAGMALATAGRDHTVKVAVTGLRPRTAYYYRFRVGGVVSETGRTTTAPQDECDLLRFGVLRGQAHAQLAQRGGLDAVLQVGALPTDKRMLARHLTNPDVRRLHAAHPVVVAGTAHLDWQPVRDGRRFRGLTFGRLVDVIVLDQRTGSDLEQREWLAEGVRDSDATWKLITANALDGEAVAEVLREAGEPNVVLISDAACEEDSGAVLEVTPAEVRVNGPAGRPVRVKPRSTP
ncbi:MAG TPA: PhoD-like phosphatase N-terminal domain-containing protein [Umezawaea sp.]|nr:PhoD-like phosphatase N-terminal domain-containing protein [Umezawaea sp.]